MCVTLFEQVEAVALIVPAWTLPTSQSYRVPTICCGFFQSEFRAFARRWYFVRPESTFDGSYGGGDPNYGFSGAPNGYLHYWL